MTEQTQNTTQNVVTEKKPGFFKRNVKALKVIGATLGGVGLVGGGYYVYHKIKNGTGGSV